MVKLIVYIIVFITILLVSSILKSLDLKPSFFWKSRPLKDIPLIVIDKTLFESDLSSSVIIKESLYGKYYAYNTIDQCIEYEYDESGNQIKKLVYNNVYYANEMALESTYEYKYDESGKLIEEKGSEFASDDYYVVYEYDEDGDLVKEIFYLDEEHTSFGGCIKYEYDNLIIEK